MDDEMCYAAVADELNDSDAVLVLADLDAEFVAGAERFARAQGLSWPPGVGDFDRYYDWNHNERRT